MSIYFKNGIKENVEKQMEIDLNSNQSPPINIDYELTDEEFEKFWIIFQASKYSNTKEFFEHWKFYLSDDIIEEIICDDDYLSEMLNDPYDFDIEECLEEAKERGIYGFADLGDDLWLINEEE